MTYKSVLMFPLYKSMRKIVRRLGERQDEEGMEYTWKGPINKDGVLEVVKERVPDENRLCMVDIDEDGVVVVGPVESLPEDTSTDNRCPTPHETVPMQLDMRWNSLKKKQILGQGAFGQVFEAEKDGQVVALKVLPPFTEQIQEVKDSLRKELAMLARVGHHPNVVKCYGGSVVGPHLFIVSELKRGGTLGTLIHKGGPNGAPQRLSPLRALKITVDILKGLDHLHNLVPMVVHRDLKPDNVLLDEAGRACVADFGLSRTKHQTYINTGNCHAGTAPYLGPEALDGTLDEKMDIYAVGVILWECLTAMRPWGHLSESPGKLPIAILFHVHNGGRLEFPPMFPKNGKLGDEWDAMMWEIRQLILQCWKDEPRKRPSCQELLHSIQDLRKRFPTYLG